MFTNTAWQSKNKNHGKDVSCSHKLAITTVSPEWHSL